MQPIRYLLALLLTILATSCAAFLQGPAEIQQGDSRYLTEMLEADPRLSAFLAHASAHKIQIIFTQVDRDKAGDPRLTTYSFRDDADFYYPASLVKLPVALATLEKLRELGLSRNHRLKIGGDNDCHRFSDTGCSSIATCIERLFIYSDNDAFNRLYEFLGSDYINRKIGVERGYRGRMQQSFKRACKGEAARRTAAVELLDAAGRTVYSQPPLTDTAAAASPPRSQMRAGRAVKTSGGLIPGPKDFSDYNYYPLAELHRMVIAVAMPEAVPPQQRFAIPESDRAFLLQAMSLLPREYGSQQPDNFRKFLFIGTGRRMPANIRIHSKVGLSYGFVSDTAYITNTKKNVEFFLSATIYTNENGIINDGRYQYDSLARPFMETLSRVVYEHELRRARGGPSQ